MIFSFSYWKPASILLIADSAVLDKYAAITRWCNLENKTNIKPYLSKTIF